jgi:S1-C subfamily serine protease
MEPRRFRLIAMSIAVAALGVASASAVVVMQRAPHVTVAAAPPPPPPPPQDRTVAAKDIAALEQPELATVDRDGLRVIDSDLAHRLGLAPGERITALSGRLLKRDLDLREAIRATANLNVNTLYVELERGDDTALVRWRVDGTLAIARYALSAGGSSMYAPLPPIVPAPPALGDPVIPVLAGLTKVDDSHFTVTRAALDAFFADRDHILRGARLVPYPRGGYKVYAIRATGLFAHLGVQNGDTVVKLNSADIDDRDQLDNARNAKEFVFELVRRNDPFEITITLK